MSDDWQVGDLALCVADGEWECPCGYTYDGTMSLRKGQTSLVLDYRLQTREEQYWGEPCSCRVLAFADKAGLEGRFRKLRPLTDEERTQAIADLRIPQRVQS